MHARSLAACAALLALAACADGESATPVGPGPAASLAVAPIAPTWNLYTSQAPTEVLDGTSAWEVGSRFRSSKPGKIIGFRFWRASGETGTNTAKLWTSGGTRLAQATLPAGTGWVRALLATPVRITANTTYRVSANTNTRQAKTGGGYAFQGHLSNGPLYSDGGYYGQPAGAMPNTESASYFFVDVIFEEDVPLPNLYVQAVDDIPAGASFSICNNGQANAGASTTQIDHRYYTSDGSLFGSSTQFVTTGPLAVGGCAGYGLPRRAGYLNTWSIRADAADAIYESNEGDNFRTIP